MKKTVLISFLLILFCLPAIKSLFVPGAYTSHDLLHHIVRQIDMDKLLTEGQFPPRWSGDLNNGFGYPLFLFNYPAPPIIGEAFHKIGFNYVNSVKAVMLLSMVISVIGMYLFLHSLLPKNKAAAFLGSIFYLYAPIRFINIYVSGSVGAALSLGILPYIFWLIVETNNDKNWTIPFGAILLALFITSHNVTALMFAPMFLIFSIILYYFYGRNINFVKRITAMFLLGLGLSSFFWLPAIYEKKFIIYDQVMSKSWVNQFPTLMQLIHSPWGYGLAHPGTNNSGAMSFQIGLTQILSITILLVITIFSKRKKEFLPWVIFSISFFLISVILMLKVSSFFWQHLPLLYLIQYPYRFLAVAVFAASLGTALLISYSGNRINKILFFVLLITVLAANRNHLKINQSYNPGDNYFAEKINDATSYNEHLPIWAYLPTQKSVSKISIINGSGEVVFIENKSSDVKATINLKTDSVLRFNQFYFPGWVLLDNGNKIQYSYNNQGENQGLPVFTLKPGLHNFEAKFVDTDDRKIADIISLSSLIVIILLVFKIFLNKKNW